MFSDNFFTISDFARLMGVSRQTLIYYDRIGLFRPIKVLGNKYRVYARSQINVLSMICMLSEMGVPLKEIQQIVDDLSPKTALEVLARQKREAEEKRRKLQMLEDMIALRMEQIAFGREISKKNFPALSLQEVPVDIPLYVGRANKNPANEMTDDFIIDFYQECEEAGFPLISPSGQLKRQEDILSGKVNRVARMYFTLRDEGLANAVLPRGLYAVAYAHGDYGDTNHVYRDLLAFLREKDLRLQGDAYEEYLLDELAESDPKNFVMRVMIRVDTPKGMAAPPCTGHI